MQNKLEPNFLIYGANGYTGTLIVQHAIAQGLKPTIAGRNAEAIKEMAQKYNLPHEVVDLNNTLAVNDMVLSTNVLLNCAGPFSRTAEILVQACIENRTHYLDITGELEVFELLAQKYHADALEEGVMLLPGVGFDIVPTDCLAAFLKHKLPTATHLQLAFSSKGGGISHGTAQTLLENIDKGGAVRENGVIKTVPAAYKTRTVEFPHGPVYCVSIPWGDVSTAYYSTGIPNIEVYIGLGRSGAQFMEIMNKFRWFFAQNKVKGFLQKILDKTVHGPTPAQRQIAFSYIWGEVTDSKLGTKTAARLICPEGYTLTALTALAAVKQALLGNAPAGFQTPAKAYGANFITQIEGVVLHEAVA